MHILTEKDVTSDTVKTLRAQAGMTQKAFWDSLGITQSGGSYYEKDHAIPRSTRILIFAMYVAGLKIDAGSAAGAAQLVRLARLQASEQAADREAIGSKMIEASKSIRNASRVLSSIVDPV